MKTIYGIITGIILAIALLVGGIFIGKYKFSTHDIEIKDRIVYQTKWKTKVEYREKKPEMTVENYDFFYNCWTSSIDFKEKTETSYSWLIFRHNYLYITAFDQCKENTARYEIGTKGNWKVYLAIAGLGAAAGGATIWYFTK